MPTPTMKPAPIVPRLRTFVRLSVLVIVLLLAATVYVWLFLYDSPEQRAARCFGLPPLAAAGVEPLDERGPLLPDVLLAERKPTAGRTIFFHETSCSTSSGWLRLNGRQVCAIESAAKANPEQDVFVLFAAPVRRPPPAASDAQAFRVLDAYANVHLRNVNLSTYALGTPLAEWWQSGALARSSYLNSHASDMLRYLTLFHWGGTYLDLDVVVMKNLSTIEPNYAGAESAEVVAAGVINLEHDSIGHRLAGLLLMEFERTFDGSDWGNNGPGVITRMLQSICRTQLSTLMTRSRCAGFRVFDANAFYAIPWRQWRDFFDPALANRTLAKLERSYVAHVWNKHSHTETVHVRQPATDSGGRPAVDQAYGIIASRHCPRALHASRTIF